MYLQQRESESPEIMLPLIERREKFLAFGRITVNMRLPTYRHMHKLKLESTDAGTDRNSGCEFSKKTIVRGELTLTQAR